MTILVNMTTTTGLEVATPETIDTHLAAAHREAASADAAIEAALHHLHGQVGDRGRIEYHGRRRVTRYELTDAAALEQARTTGAAKSWDQRSLEDTLKRHDAAVEARRQAHATIEQIDTEYDRRGGWSRFFIVDGGHIHSSMSCSTCNNGQRFTRFGWLPALSGLTEADAVAAHGALLCTVCYPSAPVEWTNGRELEAAAKAADKCTGHRDYDAPSRQGYVSGNWGTCNTCGQRVTTTSTGKLRAHKPAAS